MKLNWRALVGVLMILLGVLAMLQTLGALTFEGAIWLWVFAVIFAVVGVGFLYILFRGPVENWWAAIPGFTLLGLGTLMILVDMPGINGEWPVSIFMGSIGLSFIVVFLLDRSRWWAIIPAGSVLSIALMILFPDLGGWTASILFLGMAVTFGVVALMGKGKLNWAWIPAVALVGLGAFIPAVEGSLPWIIWPLVLIAVGAYLIGRSLLRK